MERQIIAYVLIVVMAAAAVGLFKYLRYHSRRETYRRQRLRDEAARGRNRDG